MYFALLTQAGGNPMIAQLGLFAAMAIIFYFLLIRPQSKARKQMAERLSKLKAGDEVLLSSGLYAIVDRVEDQTLYLKLGNSVVKARKTAVVAFANEPAPQQQN
ncbi:preprotein translocase subunit YajC [Holophaga foetida]|uniref:preprotein translocase subunit YajC n=1 Tax=Holophaga foetida TaxID=35839 RepID=UPI000247178E|nr:preprotein translocase subunit YajC [Holophaga foetida]